MIVDLRLPRTPSPSWEKFVTLLIIGEKIINRLISGPSGYSGDHIFLLCLVLGNYIIDLRVFQTQDQSFLDLRPSYHHYRASCDQSRDLSRDRVKIKPIKLCFYLFSIKTKVNYGEYSYSSVIKVFMEGWQIDVYLVYY